MFGKSFYWEDTAVARFLIGGVDLKMAPVWNKPKVEKTDQLDIMCGVGGCFCLIFS